MTEAHRHTAACSRVLEGVKVWTCPLTTREERHNGRKFSQEELWRMRASLGLALAALTTYLAREEEEGERDVAQMLPPDRRLVACRQLLTGVANELAPKE